MSDQATNQSYADPQLGYVYENRRYVGKKETFGFVLWDAAQSLNINTYSSRFITNIVKCTLRNQKHHRKPYYIYIYNGKCKECGRPVKFDDFEAYCGWKCDSCWKKFWDDIEDEL